MQSGMYKSAKWQDIIKINRGVNKKNAKNV